MGHEVVPAHGHGGVIDSRPAHTNASPAFILIAPAAMWTDCMGGPAEAVDGGAGRGHGQLGKEPDEARHVVALLPFREGATYDHVLQIPGSTPVSSTRPRTT